MPPITTANDNIRIVDSPTPRSERKPEVAHGKITTPSWLVSALVGFVICTDLLVTGSELAEGAAGKENHSRVLARNGYSDGAHDIRQGRQNALRGASCRAQQIRHSLWVQSGRDHESQHNDASVEGKLFGGFAVTVGKAHAMCVVQRARLHV